MIYKRLKFLIIFALISYINERFNIHLNSYVKKWDDICDKHHSYYEIKVQNADYHNFVLLQMILGFGLLFVYFRRVLSGEFS